MSQWQGDKQHPALARDDGPVGAALDLIELKFAEADFFVDRDGICRRRRVSPPEVQLRGPAEGI